MRFSGRGGFRRVLPGLVGRGGVARWRFCGVRGGWRVAWCLSAPAGGGGAVRFWLGVVVVGFAALVWGGKMMPGHHFSCLGWCRGAARWWGGACFLGGGVLGACVFAPGVLLLGRRGGSGRFPLPGWFGLGGSGRLWWRVAGVPWSSSAVLLFGVVFWLSGAGLWGSFRLCCGPAVAPPVVCAWLPVVGSGACCWGVAVGPFFVVGGCVLLSSGGGSRVFGPRVAFGLWRWPGSVRAAGGVFAGPVLVALFAGWALGLRAGACSGGRCSGFFGCRGSGLFVGGSSFWVFSVRLLVCLGFFFVSVAVAVVGFPLRVASALGFGSGGVGVVVSFSGAAGRSGWLGWASAGRAGFSRGPLLAVRSPLPVSGCAVVVVVGGFVAGGAVGVGGGLCRGCWWGVCCVLSVRVLPLFVVRRGVGAGALFACGAGVRRGGLAGARAGLLRLASLRLCVGGWGGSGVVVWLRAFVSGVVSGSVVRGLRL